MSCTLASPSSRARWASSPFTAPLIFSFPYIPVELALRDGTAELIERADATVPTLALLNRSESPILIIDGDELVGGWQNRVANATFLVPALSDFELSVSCVEQGRWDAAGANFRAGEAANPTLRAQKVEDVNLSYAAACAPVADQMKVWNEVAANNGRSGTSSSTGAMLNAYQKRDAELRRVPRRLPRPDDAPIGVIATIAGHARCFDLFDEPGTLRLYWDRLVRSYALEAIGKPPIHPSLDSAVRLIGRARKAERAGYPSLGLGTDVRFNGHGVTGAALVCEDIVVHAALFRRREKAVSGRCRF